MARKISEDEIASVRAVGEDEIQSVAAPEELEQAYVPQTSPLEASVRGAAQSITFNTADEIAARLESLSTGKPYEQALAESRAEHKLSEEQHPIASAVGGIAGGVAQGVGLTALTGGLGAPAAATGAVGRLTKLGQLAKGALVPTTEASALKNIATAARTGAIMGGLSGYGASEKEGMEALKEIPTAAISGGILGGALGGAVEGLGVGAKKLGERISKGIDEGKYPELFRMVRTGAKLGEQGKTFISEGAKKEAKTSVIKAAENVVNNLDEEIKKAKDVRNFIVDNSSQKLIIDDILTNLRDDLSKVYEVDAEPTLQSLSRRIKTIMKSATPADKTKQLVDVSGKPITSQMYNEINPRQAYSIVKEIRHELSKEDLPESLRNPFKNAVSELKDRINGSIDEKEVQNILNKNSKIKTDYESLLADTTEDIKDEAGQVISSGTRNLPTLRMLDDKMSKILTASEVMGINPTKTGLAEKISDEQKLSRLFFNLTEETKSGMLGEDKFQKAMDVIGQSSPSVVQKIKSTIEPVKETAEFLRYTEGQGGISPRTSDRGFIGNLLGDVGRYGAEAVNIATATKAAARAGKAGPIPGIPTTTMIRPTVSGLSSAKTIIDSKIAAEPNNKVYPIFSQLLDNALQQKDDSRRAAILNTLMQYKTFREMVKDDEETK